MNDGMTILVVVVAFGVGYFLVSKLMNFNRAIVANRPQMAGGAGVAEKEFLWHVCLMAKGVAMVDGSVNAQEFAVIRDYVSRMTTADVKLNEMLIKLVNDPASPPMSVERHAEQCLRLKGDRRMELTGLIALLESVAAADGQVNEAEQRLLRSVRGMLQL